MLYRLQINSTDAVVKDRAFEQLFTKLQKVTHKIIYREYKSFSKQADEVFSEMTAKVFECIRARKIRTENYFFSWYRKVLKHHIRDKIRYRNRKKRANIVYESNLPFELTDAEIMPSIEEYNRQIRIDDAREAILMIERSGIDYEMFFERHIDNESETVLAMRYNTTVDGVKGRLKRTKKILRTFLYRNQA